MKLADIQAAFQAAVLGDEARVAVVVASIDESPKAPRETLFDIYAYAYRSRLTEILSSDYPALRHLLGDAEFAALVDAYIASAPSRHRNARYYSSNLPDFMRAATQWRENQLACDLAVFERALMDGFDAPDAITLSMNDLFALSPDAQPAAIFRFHPSVAILDLAGGVTMVYEGKSTGFSTTEYASNAETVLVWRQNGDCAYRVVDSEERLALLEARRGHRFADICALLAFKANDEDVAARVGGFLVQWLNDGILTGLSLSQSH